MFTIKDVASDAGVSTATVSRVLNKEENVSEVTCRKVNASITKLGYRLHSAASTLKSGKSRIIGVIVPELSNIFWMTLFEYIEDILQKAGYIMVLGSSGNSVAGEIRQLDSLQDRMVDGIIVIPCSQEGTHFKKILDKGLPLVFLDRWIPEIHADSVLVDNEGGTYDVIRALISDGFQKIGFVGGDMSHVIFRERFSGYKHALMDAGIPFNEKYTYLSGIVLETGYFGMKRLLEKKDHPDAFFYVNLMTSLGAAQYLIKEAPEIQKKIVCAGFDNVYFSSLLCCRYLVAQPEKEMGKLVAQMILDKVRHTDSCTEENRVIRLKTELIRC